MALAPPPSAGTAAKKRGKLPLIVLALVCVGSGAALPMFVNLPGLTGANKVEAKQQKKSDQNSTTIPFGDVVVNLAEDRMTRYLRVKISLKVDADDEKNVTDLVAKNKAEMKSKLISYLAGKSLKDVSGSVGVNKIQREILEKFDDILYPDGNSRLREVLFEEYVVQ